MRQSDIVVRAPSDSAEVDAYFQTAGEAFTPEGKPITYESWRDTAVAAPGYDREQIRCAFMSGQVVGGCIVHRRNLRAGPARLLTACIGGVATSPLHRKQGIATAVLEDVHRLARANGYALALLDGIPEFYYRFGYADVFDYSWQRIERNKIAALPPSQYTVRPATKADARAMLDLFERNYSRYIGSFERSLERQYHELPAEPSTHGPVIACSPEGELRGYLVFTDELRGARAGEVGADDWPATRALLAYHEASLTAAGDASTELAWPLPTDSRVFELLSDRLEIRTEVHRQPRADWQALVADGSVLLTSLLPLWQERFARVATEYPGTLRIDLAGNGSIDLALGSSVQAVERADRVGATVVFPPAVFVKLLFGERTLEWAQAQVGVEVPIAARPAVEALLDFPPAWIPGTDAF